MLEPVVHGEGFFFHAFFDRSFTDLLGEADLVKDVDICPEILVLAVISGKPLFRQIPVFLVLRIQPPVFVKLVIGVVHHHDRKVHGFRFESSSQEFLDERLVGIQHQMIGLQEVLWIFPAYAVLPPFPQVKGDRKILDILGQIHGEDVEITILMNCQLLVPADIVVNQVLPAVDLSVDKSRIIFSIYILKLFCNGIFCLFDKHGNK